MTSVSAGHGLPALSCVWQHVKLSDVSLGTRPRHSLVVDENGKKPTKQIQTVQVGPPWGSRSIQPNVISFLFGLALKRMSRSD